MGLTVAIIVLGISSSLQAQEPDQEFEQINEEEVLERALNRPELVEQWEAQVRSAEAEIYSEGAWPNPSIGVKREQFFGAGGAEDTLEVEQLIPLAGRRGLRSEAARMDAEAREFQVAADRADLAASVREVFFDVMRLQRAVELYEEALVRMQVNLDSMTLLVEQGESSRYELERLRRDMADIRADLAIRRAELERKRAILAGWLGNDSGPSLYVSGTLLPVEIPEDDEVRQAIDSQPQLIASDRQIDSLRLSRDAAARWWIPDLLLRGGAKTEGGEERTYGMVVGLGLSIPLFYRGRGEEQAAEANLVEAINSRSLRAQYLRARALGFAREARSLKAATREYEEEAVARAEQVLEFASQSYAGGEATIADLLDAHQGLLNAELREMELAAQCRKAFVELERLLDGTTREGGS